MDAFFGEIRLMAFNWTPRGWFPCDGRSLAIAQYQGLASVIGYTYGGAGPTFNIPNFSGLVVVGVGDDPTDTFDPQLTQTGGASAVALSVANMPSHTHTLSGGQIAPKLRVAAGAGNWIGSPAFLPSNGTSPETANGFETPAGGETLVGLNPNTLPPYVGAGTAHENRQPYLVLQYCICWDGALYPVRP